jgi:hypothetical protein
MVSLLCAGTGLNLLFWAFQLLQRVEVILEHEFVLNGDRGMDWCLVGINMIECGVERLKRGLVMRGIDG